MKLQLAIYIMLVLFLTGCQPKPPFVDNQDQIQENGVANTQPALVLVLTIDQLRADTPLKYRDAFGAGGFEYLFEQGLFFSNTFYQHANTETAVGHATILTGAFPSDHGIVGNDWIDPDTGAFVYNTEDPDHHILGKPPKAHTGVSPANLDSETLGDVLVAQSPGSRVFSVSGKDRGAILPGGKQGKAFWYSKSSGEFVTSSYYYDAYPDWAADWNALGHVNRYKGKRWDLLKPRESYRLLKNDDRPFEAAFMEVGRVFPHSYSVGMYLPLQVGLTPAIDELTIDFALNLLTSEKLGQGDSTDMLAISLSATDYVGHLFGPGSLEAEDNLYRLDKQLARLFAGIDELIGLNSTLIVLTADHGGPYAPEVYTSNHGAKTGRLSFDFINENDALKQALNQTFDRDDIFLSHSHPYVYLNQQALDELALQGEDALTFVQQALTDIPGVLMASKVGQQTGSEATGTSAANLYPPDVDRLIANNYYPGRSGQLHLVQDQYWFMHSTDEADKMGLPGLAAIHGSPWEYDRHVPLFFVGAGITPGVTDRPATVNDIAPTLANLLDLPKPEHAAGVSLVNN